MATDYGVPPRGSQISDIVKGQIEEAVKSNGEKVTIEWRGQPKHLYVISMPVELLYYNPDTHRIRAQRSLDPVRDRELQEEPWGESAQDYLDYLLKRQPSDPDKTDPDFEALRDDLESFGQRDPGLISVYGVLVNGNTRCAALRELGEKYIRVGVLPETADWDDINTVELSLQLRKEQKRDYSYINRLIAMDEQLTLGRRPEDIAREFRIKKSTLEQDQWVYGVIRDAIERSKTDDGAMLREIDFEDHQEKLRELYRAYTKAAATDQDAAELLKNTRLAMIVLGYAKTDLRFAQPDFYEKYLEPKLTDDLKPTVGATASIRIPGLDVEVPGAGPEVRIARAFADDLLKAKAQAQTVSLAGGNGAGSAAGAKLAAARSSFDRALKPAGKDARLQQLKLAAPERLSDACDDIELCAGDLAQSRATRAIDDAAFDDAVLRLRTAVVKLAKEARRTFTEPGEGVDWLLTVAEASQ